MTDKIIFYDSNGLEQNSSNINITELKINGMITTQSSIRAIVDPTSNPGPLNGLLIPSQPDFFLKLPLRTNTNIPALGLTNGYLFNYNNEFTLGPDSITINVTGQYHVSFGIIALSTNQNERKSTHLLESTQTMFVDPPIIFDADRQGNSLNLPPYTFSYNSCASGEIYIPAGKSLSLFLYLNNNTSNNEILRNSYLTISRIS